MHILSTLAPDGLAFDPPVVPVDPETTLRREWTGKGDAHSGVRAGRSERDPGSVPDPVSGQHTYRRPFEFSGMDRYACYEHHEEGMRGAVIVLDDEDRYAFAREDCNGDLPAGDGVGNTGGDRPWT